MSISQGRALFKHLCYFGHAGDEEEGDELVWDRTLGLT